MAPINISSLKILFQLISKQTLRTTLTKIIQVHIQTRQDSGLFKQDSIYCDHNFFYLKQASVQYGGYNGFESSPHSSSTFSSPDPNKNLENFPDSMSRQGYDFFEKQPDTPMVMAASDVTKSQKAMADEGVLADDLTVPRNSDDTSRTNDKQEEQPEVNLEELDHLPLMHDLPELKPGDNEVRPSSDSSPHRGLKRGLSPPNDTQDSGSQDSYGVGQQHGMIPGHQENEFLPNMNEGGKCFID